MKEGIPRVDEHLVNVYREILMDKLSRPEEWTDSKNERYRSFSIRVSPKAPTTFRTNTIQRNEDYDKITEVYICSKDDEWAKIWTIPVDNRKTRKLIRNLFEYMKRLEEWKKFEEIDKALKNALPDDIDRYLKISKIKSNL